MKVSIQNISRIRIGWESETEEASVSKILKRIQKGGIEHSVVNNSCFQNIKGEMIGSITIEIYEDDLPKVRLLLK